MLDKHATSLREQSATIKARITELQNKLGVLDEKFYIEGAIPADTYEKLKRKLAAEKLLAIEIMSSTLDASSNLKNCFDLVVAISRKLAPTWRSADFSTREKIQKMLFPDGIVYHFKNEEFRTLKVNKWLEVIPLLARVSGDDKNKKGSISAAFLISVGKTGFEPATPWSQTRCATGLRYFPIRLIGGQM